MSNQSLAARRITRALPALLLWCLASAAWAGSFRIAPALAEVAPGASVASFRISNSGKDPLPIQIEAFAWEQDEGGDRHTASSDLVIIPRIATVAPGATQLVRVALRARSRERELAFRLHFVELPMAASPGFVGVRTTVRFDVPLFFAASAEPPKMQWSVSLAADGAARLSAANAGGRFQRLAAVRLVDARGALLAERKGPLYILPGRGMQWPLTTHARLAAGDEVMLETTLDAGTQAHRLQIR